ncbi:hypothetical protein O181_081049 [Austropuccinia psidii MF-1]|uniref:Uncharacterized protein n=1 Tax=Austropuccinia psidii MF-1 TaxID=1389203 RepID=A0A9Q3FLL8_9BASI|nr:hypothetical protein [Austropuccinia psidii MF-1]
MISSCSINHSSSCHQGIKPTAQSEAWKKDHSCSYDNLSWHPTTNIQSRSPRTTKDFNLKFFRRTGSQSGSKDQKIIATKQKMQDKSNFIDNSETNTELEDKSRNTITNNLSNTAVDSIFKISMPHCFETGQSCH